MKLVWDTKGNETNENMNAVWTTTNCVYEKRPKYDEITKSSDETYWSEFSKTYPNKVLYSQKKRERVKVAGTNTLHAVS